MSVIVATEVIFDAYDVAVAHEAAIKRLEAAEITEAAGVRQGTYREFEIELVGVMGEIACARYYGVEPDLEALKIRSEGGADIMVDGKTANIKATIWRNIADPHLLVRDYDTKYDAYILCAVSFDNWSVMILGSASNQLVKSTPPDYFRDQKVKTRAIPLSKLDEPNAWLENRGGP